MLRLSDEQWERIREHFPEENIPDGRPGRKPVPAREVLEAVLWILNTGAQWHMLPQCYPNYKTVHRRFQQWCEREVLRAVLTQLANALREQGDIDERESFIDAWFASAKGGGDEIGTTRRGKGVKILAIVDRHGLPLSVSTHAANHHEVTLVQLSFDFYMIEAKPENLIGDKAYDSDVLGRKFAGKVQWRESDWVCELQETEHRLENPAAFGGELTTQDTKSRLHLRTPSPRLRSASPAACRRPRRYQAAHRLCAR